MASITVRSLGPNYDPLWGQGVGNFLSDIDAVGQIIGTRLRLFEGEWWEDTTDGLPLWQKILGQYNGKNTEAIALLIQDRILGTPFVVRILQQTATYNPNTRAFTYTAQVQTAFGVLNVTNIPTPPVQTLP